MSETCGSLLLVRLEAVRSLSVDAVACKPVAGALFVDAAVNLITDLGSALLQSGRDDVAQFVPAVGPAIFSPHIYVVFVQHWFREF